MTDLTILLPLKGRDLHTLRFLWHANAERTPYRFLIADGGTHPVVAALLKESSNIFPSLDIEYEKFPTDITYTDYFRKMAEASGVIRTRYAMQADNDDFIMRSGIDHCLAFLDENKDYVGCGGRVGGFSLRTSSSPLDQVTGEIRSLGPRYHEAYVPEDYSSPSAADRVRKCFNTSYTLYYSVFRSGALATICRECADMDFRDMQVHESYFGARAKVLGKCRLDGAVMSYIRQAGTSMIDSRTYVDWVKHLVSGRFGSDIGSFVREISRLVAEADGIDASEFSDELRERYEEKLECELRDRYGCAERKSLKAESAERLRKTLLSILPKGAITLRRRASRRRAIDVLHRELRVLGATEHDMSAFDENLAGILRVFDDGRFSEFIQQHARELISP